MAVRRLTRKERQAHTRSCLMKSAAKVFARRGLHRASIDEVAQDAGFTKGAFYANFKSKEELFLAMLDERFAERLRDIESAIASGAAPEAQARQARLGLDGHVLQSLGLVGHRGEPQVNADSP
jgi:AcrR family transcriptional regulator